MAEINVHFMQTVAGAPPELLAQLGEALLALEAQRRGEEAGAAAKLRAVYLALARHVVRNSAGGLNPQQQLFLMSGALADSVALKAPSGDRVTIELLPLDFYSGLLASLSESNGSSGLPACILTPQRRIATVARGLLKPLDPAKPGRFMPEQLAAAGPAANIGDWVAELRQARADLAASQQVLTANLQRFADSMRGERLIFLMKQIGDFAVEVAALARSEDPALLGTSTALAAGHEAELATSLDMLRDEADAQLTRLAEAVRQVAGHARRVRGAAQLLLRAEGQALAMPESTLVVSEPGLKLVEKDMETLHGMVTHTAGSSGRSSLASSRILISEHLERLENPLSQCCATPANLAAALAKVHALHPNCFKLDAAGRSLIPPLVIEPGLGILRWLDDRYMLGFICNEPAQNGKELSLSPLEIAVLRVYGWYLARGDIFNYRGERISGNFMAEYSGEIESRAQVKFTGEQKKMTYVSASTERDAASREDAVRDYVDFLFAISNNLPVPKRISARKVSVFLKFCIFGDVPRTATLVLRHVAQQDFQLAREILTNLAQKDSALIVQLFRNALADDVQLATRYRRDLSQALREVMGREFLADVKAKGLLDGQPAAAISDAGKPAAEEQQSRGHDYFDL